VTFVEIMLPCFRADVLHDLLWTLDLTDTGMGWGLDALWPKLLGYQDIHVMDETPVLHTRPVGQMRDPDLDHRVRAEMDAIVERFDCPFHFKTLDATTLDGRVISDPDPALLQTLVAGYASVFAREPDQREPFIQRQAAPSPEPSR
jgi:hypothetical protein